MNDLIPIATFVVIAFPLSLLFSPIGEAFLVAPLIALCMAIISCPVQLIFDLGLLAAYVLVAFILTAICLLIQKTRRMMLVNSNTKISYLDLMFITIFAIFVIGFLINLPPPLAWDARSIWLFHASWLTGGAETFSYAQDLSALSFSHPGYPLGGAAAIAIVWLISGSTENLPLGVTLIALITLTNSILIVRILMFSFSKKAQLVTSFPFSLILVSLIFLSEKAQALTGYMDVLLASLIGVATAALLSVICLITRSNTGNDRNRFLWLSVLAIFAAVSIKQEGIFFSLVLIFTFSLVCFQDRLRTGFLILSAAASYVLWSLAIWLSGGSKESDASGIVTNLPELLNRDSIAWSNFSVIWNGYFKNYVVFPNFLFLVAMLALLTHHSWKRYMKVAIFASIVWIGNWVVIFTPYMFGQTRSDLNWWLDTSFSRIVATPIVFVIIFCGFVLVNSFNGLLRHEDSCAKPMET